MRAAASGYLFYLALLIVGAMVVSRVLISSGPLTDVHLSLRGKLSRFGKAEPRNIPRPSDSVVETIYQVMGKIVRFTWMDVLIHGLFATEKTVLAPFASVLGWDKVPIRHPSQATNDTSLRDIKEGLASQLLPSVLVMDMIRLHWSWFNPREG